MSLLRPPATDDGFTLVEILVAIGLLALALAVVPSTWRLATQALRAGDYMEQRQTHALVLDEVRRRVADAIDIGEFDGVSRMLGSIRGDDRSLTLLVAHRAGAGGGGLQRHVISCEGNRLVIDVTPFVPRGSPDRAEASSRALTIGPCRWSYFGAASDGARDAWLPGWTRGDALPRLVGLIDEATETPRLIVEIRNRPLR